MTKAEVRFWKIVELVSSVFIIYNLFLMDRASSSSLEPWNIHLLFSLIYWLCCARRGRGYVLIELFNKIGLSGLLMALLHYSLAFTCTMLTIGVVLSFNIPDIPKAILFMSFIGLPAVCFQGYKFLPEKES